MWTENRIRTLIDAGTPETATLEFKSQLPERSDRDRAEFLKDVSAMANATGGSIIFGVRETAGEATGFAGLMIEDPDVETRRLSQILEAGIEPRLNGVRLTPLRLAEGDLLIIDVPESFDSPHRYLFNGHSRFVTRVGSHASELDYQQLRAAFDRSSARLQRIREQWALDFGLSRLWKPIISGPVCIVRLSSLASADGRQLVDPKAAYDKWSDLIMSDWGGGSPSFNYEGLVIHHGRGQDALAGYVQVYRTGALTGYRTARLTINEKKIIPSGTIAKFIFEAAEDFIKFLRSSGLVGAAVLNVGLQRVRGYEFGTGSRYGMDDDAVPEFPYEEIQMPELWIEDIEDPSLSLNRLLRPSLDLLWQSYGWSECTQFDADGCWHAP